MKLSLPLTALTVLLAAACSDDGGGGGGGADAGPDSSTDSGTGGAPPVPEASPEAEPTPDAKPDAPESPFPLHLSETGLFSDIATETLGKNVEAYEPKYVLWSDGATKRRWVRLPAGKQIDTSDMDFWKYPAGTTAWKEFSRDGKRLETRMLQKGPTRDDWLMISYAWREDGSDADAVPEGKKGVQGTDHDIPAAVDCYDCHRNMPDTL